MNSKEEEFKETHTEALPKDKDNLEIKKREIT
jgi:hypothetical protein